MKALRTIKVFCDRKAQAELLSKYDVLESYENFLLLNVVKSDAKAISKDYPIEDISDQYNIHIGNRKIDTNHPRIIGTGVTRAHKSYRNIKRLSSGKHHYLVQFIGPIKVQWLRKLKLTGAELRAPYSSFTYILRCEKDVLKQIVSLPYVRWLGHLSHKDRIQLGRPGAKLPRTHSLGNVYVIEFFDKVDMKAAKSKVKKLGLKILSHNDGAATITVNVPSPKMRQTLLQQLSAVHGVRAIRDHAFNRTSNNVAAGIMQTEEALGNTLGLDGSGEIVAVCDTGLDTGDKNTMHADFKGRVVAMKSYPIPDTYMSYLNNASHDDGSADLDSGHGTHVAGSVLGSGKSSENVGDNQGLVRGLAYEAKLVFQAVEQELKWKNFNNELEYGRFNLVGIPDDLKSLFQYAYTKGARIHSNSWGGGNPGEYDSQCHQLDQFVWKHKDFCVVVAAGNDGTDADGDGVINAMSVTSPGTAKNCITVGACENFRPTFSSEKYGTWWPTDYPVAPYAEAPMTDNPNQVVAFSSRGPTQDNRIKPDIVAPGTFVLSTRSRKLSNSNHGWAPYPQSSQYFYMGGTSMATPLVSGALALLRQFFREWVGYESPSAALLKASLISGADKLSGYSPAGLAGDNSQGFGRVNIDAIVAPASPLRVYFLDDDIGLHTGQADEFTFSVRSSGHPLRIVLAYSDYPGVSLVNNLNLMVTDPQGKHHVMNSSAGGALLMDTNNNVEVVNIKSPIKGRWKMKVIASGVPQGPQEYAFVLSGHVSA
ncbi:MAG: S8 family serine peptidase [Pseudomonadales bacterium]|nr:S8 family serine peptidase [Pseudomonadales bacterium]